VTCPCSSPFNTSAAFAVNVKLSRKTVFLKIHTDLQNDLRLSRIKKLLSCLCFKDDDIYLQSLRIKNYFLFNKNMLIQDYLRDANCIGRSHNNIQSIFQIRVN